MEGYTRKDDGCPQLLDLIPKEREWVSKSSEKTTSHGVSEEKTLELTLGPPTGEWTTTSRGREGLVLSVGNFPTSPCVQNPILMSPSPWQLHQTHKLHTSYLHLQSGHEQVAVNKESSQSVAEKKAFSAAQKRTAPASASVVGWPPIRSFRKNIASGSSCNLGSESPDAAAPSKVKSSNQRCSRIPFVKINMDGIPIGRKLDITAYDSYEKLSMGVDELFKGLLAAQGEEKGGILDGRGEYALVYEDNEGDRMLVGDVPWNMFVSAVKRLRVLRSSELPAFTRDSKCKKLNSVMNGK